MVSAAAQTEWFRSGLRSLHHQCLADLARCIQQHQRWKFGDRTSRVPLEVRRAEERPDDFEVVVAAAVVVDDEDDVVVGGGGLAFAGLTDADARRRSDSDAAAA